MGNYNEIFNRASIYDTIFLNVKGVLEYLNLEMLKNENNDLYEAWKFISKYKYSCDLDNNIDYNTCNEIYKKNAIFYPEFNKIIAITYAIVFSENGQIKRNFKKFVSLDEKILLESFMNEFKNISNDSVESLPSIFPTLCGYNIIGYDIPLLLKRYIFLFKNDENKQIPLIFKKYLSNKPWENGIIDIMNVWKFNGFENSNLLLISNFLKLKKNVEILPIDELSEYYWNNIYNNDKDTLDFIALQSATQVNLCIQFMNLLRFY